MTLTTEQAIKELNDMLAFEIDEFGEVPETEEAVYMAINALKERKTGKWIEKNGMYICTACEHRLSKLAVYDVGGIYNYCPNCGANMGVDG